MKALSLESTVLNEVGAKQILWSPGLSFTNSR